MNPRLGCVARYGFAFALMAGTCGGCGGNSISGSTGTAGGGAGASGSGGSGGGVGGGSGSGGSGGVGSGGGGSGGVAGRGGSGGGGLGGVGSGGGGSGGVAGRGGSGGGGGAGGSGDAGVNACSPALNGTACDAPDTTCYYEMHPAGTQNYYYGCTCSRADGGGNTVSCCFVGNAFSPSGLTPASMPDWWLTPSGSPARCPSGS